MRTAIFLGFIAVADAIRKDWLVDSNVIKVLSIVLIVMMFMDVVEFVKKIRS